jgi:hypothetical protein
MSRNAKANPTTKLSPTTRNCTVKGGPRVSLLSMQRPGKIRLENSWFVPNLALPVLAPLRHADWLGRCLLVGVSRKSSADGLNGGF